MNETIIPHIAHEQYIKDLALYTIATNLVRALPDARDGLKPVSRRIIYALMHDEKAISPSTKVKSAAVEGTVMKKYHPHSGTYQTFKTLINWFEVKQPIVNGQGSFGTVSGEGPSASRYTECYLNKFGLDCVCGALSSNDEVVEWNPTYDNKHVEPQYLPVKVPLLLINGISGGIGTGIKADLPSHNITEVIDATLNLIRNPDANVILIPDHCLPCDIVDTDWKNICNKGFGTYIARATMVVSYDKNDYPIITITSLPTYGTNTVVEKIDEGIASGKFPQILDINDESKNDYGVRIVIKLKKGTDVNFVQEALYKYTPCEQSFRVNFEVVLGTELVRLSYKEYLRLFINFAVGNKIIEYGACRYVISTKLHKLDAFIKVVGSSDIDKIIQMIKNRKTNSDKELIEFLIDKYKLTDIQAEYIINAQIKQLSKGYLEKYKQEYAELHEKEIWLEQRLVDDSLIISDICEELIRIRKEYGKPRICKLIKVSNLGAVPEGTFKLVVTANGYIRKLAENEAVLAIKGDLPKFVQIVSNTENILLFDSKGRVFKLAVAKLPIMSKMDIGIDIKKIIKSLTADIVALMYEPFIKHFISLKTKSYIVILSKGNTIKKLDIQDFLNVPPSGIIYSKLNLNDDIVSVKLAFDDEDAVLYTGYKALRISVSDITLLKRNTLEGMSIVPTKSQYIIVVTKSGQVNKFLSSGFERSQRNKAGNRVITLMKGDKIQNIFGATDSDNMQITTSNGTILTLAIKDILLGSSISKGISIGTKKTEMIISSILL